jgi:mannosidase alpha-like ER degradation enhancer 2
MWQKESIEPEEIDYQTMKITSPGYPLRPEIVESAYYLYHYANLRTRKSRAQSNRAAAQVPLLNDARKLEPNHYLRMGETMWRDFVKYCRTDEGYAALKSVITKEKSDSMQSFLFAETFKYFYLLFASRKTLDFDRVIFNTEAHPTRRNN